MQGFHGLDDGLRGWSLERVRSDDDDPVCDCCDTDLRVGKEAYYDDRTETWMCEACMEDVDVDACNDPVPGTMAAVIDEEDRSMFADPGGRSALRAATASNPRNQPCPTCKRPNMLTPADVRKGYQCDRCADAEEGCF